MYNRTNSPCVHILQHIICTHTHKRCIQIYTIFCIPCVHRWESNFLFVWFLLAFHFVRLVDLSHWFLLWFVAAYYEPRLANFKYIIKNLCSTSSISLLVSGNQVWHLSLLEIQSYSFNIIYHLVFAGFTIHWTTPPKTNNPPLQDSGSWKQHDILSRFFIINNNNYAEFQLV